MKTLYKSTYKVGGGTVELLVGTITRYDTKALVCPANIDLTIVAFPGNIQNDFLTKFGKELFELEAILKPVPPTSAYLKVTKDSHVKHVIHSVAVGCDKEEKGEYCNVDIIRESTRNVLKLANENSIKSIGFPPLGVMDWKLPLEDAVNAMGDEFAAHLNGNTSIDKIGLVLHYKDLYKPSMQILDKKHGYKKVRK